MNLKKVSKYRSGVPICHILQPTFKWALFFKMGPIYWKFVFLKMTSPYGKIRCGQHVPRQIGLTTQIICARLWRLM